MIDKPLQLVAHILVEQSQYPHSDSREEQGLSQLEGCDQDKPPIVVPR